MIGVRLLSLAVFCYSLRLARSNSIDSRGLRESSDDSPFQNGQLLDWSKDISMTLYTDPKQTKGQKITSTEIPPDFKGDLDTWFIVHGYLSDSVRAKWMHDIKNAALQKGRFNIIIVDWGAGAKKFIYAKAAYNTKTVGKEIALVAKNTIDQRGSQQSRLYCVGHSLGAHVCGYAGQGLKFGRITGLDPAGPSFKSCSPTCGLGPSSADLVDVIHTDGKKFGMMNTVGHIDFYPNGGGRQPGCILDQLRRFRTSDDLVSAEDDTVLAYQRFDFLSCSHSRAIEYFVESLKNDCFLSRAKCVSIAELSGCSSDKGPVLQRMGYAAKDFAARGIFYLKTNKKSPYCVG